MTAIRETKTRHLVGTTTWLARAYLTIPLDDPTATGNGGLEGYDEDAISREFKTKAAAVRWLRQQAATQPHMRQGMVTETEWEPEEFDDDTYGHILDAIDVARHTWSWWVGEGRTLEPDGDWSER